MSCIFKGDSIYKSGGGGGGGGYKDGGQLVDGDFIKVENNTISSYDNVSRDPVNFYFEVKDGEVLNAVIELTNEYNATVHVYIVQNGLFIPLGNVGGDTVNAGDDYKINIVGNSFVLEVVTPSQPTPEAVIFGGVIYPCKKFGNHLWMLADLKGFGGMYSSETDSYYYNYNDIQSQIQNFNGWHLPDDTITKELFTELGDLGGVGLAPKLKSTDSVWLTSNNNSSGMNCKVKGYVFFVAGRYRISMISDNDPSGQQYSCVGGFTISNSDNALLGWPSSSDGHSTVRLVYDL